VTSAWTLPSFSSSLRTASVCDDNDLSPFYNNNYDYYYYYYYR